MEKYRKFADEATGVNPFLPSHFIGPYREPMIPGQVFLLVLLLILRIPFILFNLLMMGITDLIFLYVPSMQRVLFRPAICLWLALWCGVHFMPVLEAADYRRLKMKHPSAVVDPLACRIWLAPFHGFYDVLLHGIVVRPTWFVFPALDGTFVVCRTILGALRTAMACPIEKGTQAALPDSTTSAEVLLVFATAAPSNGHGILRSSPAITSLHLSNYQIIKIDYHDGDCSYGPQHMVGTWYSHLWKMLTRSGGAWNVSVSFLPDFACETSQLEPLLSRLKPVCPQTKLDSNDYVEFRKYWEETQRADYASKKAK